jgi:rhomboid family GlyGly-CTERM serine protease
MHRVFLKLRGFRAEAAAGAGSLLVLLLQAGGAAAGMALEYRRDALASQPWRLLTGHFVHLGWLHALLNCAAWLAMANLFRHELGARLQLAMLAASSLLIGAAFVLFEPQLAWYRGLSGALHALFCTGAVLWIASPDEDETRSRGRALAWALLAGAWLKVLAETAGGAHFSPPSWLGAPVVTRAHLYGAAAGTLLGAALARLRRPSSAQRSRPASGC